jgi:methylated-DNA-[protein]-cysteine S-methyltransferase
MVYDSYNSPIGSIYVVMDEQGIVRVALTEEQWQKCQEQYSGMQRDQIRCQQAIGELAAYFAGNKQLFSTPLSLTGTTFHQKVWTALLTIPFGETRTYSEIAAAVGNPQACRAVGQANRSNPLPIFIPCHRVIGKNGTMTGYMGDKVGLKEFLLKLEQAL